MNLTQEKLFTITASDGFSKVGMTIVGADDEKHAEILAMEKYPFLEIREVVHVTAVYVYKVN